MIRITNKPCKRFKIDSDNDEAPIKISSDDNNKLDEENETEKNKIEENETKKNKIEKSEIKKKAKIKMR